MTEVFNFSSHLSFQSLSAAVSSLDSFTNLTSNTSHEIQDQKISDYTISYPTFGSNNLTIKTNISEAASQYGAVNTPNSSLFTHQVSLSSTSELGFSTEPPDQISRREFLANVTLPTQKWDPFTEDYFLNNMDSIGNISAEVSNFSRWQNETLIGNWSDYDARYNDTADYDAAYLAHEETVRTVVTATILALMILATVIGEY